MIHIEKGQDEQDAHRITADDGPARSIAGEGTNAMHTKGPATRAHAVAASNFMLNGARRAINAHGAVGLSASF